MIGKVSNNQYFFKHKNGLSDTYPKIFYFMLKMSIPYPNRVFLSTTSAYYLTKSAIKSNIF